MLQVQCLQWVKEYMQFVLNAEVTIYIDWSEQVVYPTWKTL